MIVECSRVPDHPKAESRQAALKKGWYQDKDAKWVCPKCQRGLAGRTLNIETQQQQERMGTNKRGWDKRGKPPIVSFGADLAV